MDGTFSLVVDETVTIFFPERKYYQRQTRRELPCQRREHSTGRIRGDVVRTRWQHLIREWSRRSVRNALVIGVAGGC
jgi:hypothetical protein